MKLTEKFEEILKDYRFDENWRKFTNEQILDQLIQAVKERDQEVLGQDKHWSYKEHDCKECRGVNKRVHKIAQRMEETL